MSGITGHLSYGGADTLTQFQVLARLRHDTGLVPGIRRDLKLTEDLSRVRVTDTMVQLVFTVKEYRLTARGRIQTREGVRTYAAVKILDRWSMVGDLTQMIDVENGAEEVHRGRVESAEESMERIAHEGMCHRPGSSRHPMDTASRIAQKKRLGL